MTLIYIYKNCQGLVQSSEKVLQARGARAFSSPGEPQSSRATLGSDLP